MPTQFMAKTWIFVVQALVCGGLALFSLILGPLFLLGILKDANGAPAIDAGIALTVMSIPFLLVFALALYNIRARRRPLVRICREGLEIIEIGSTSLDEIPAIPGLVRLAWCILSTQGFRQEVIRLHWEDLQDAWVSGPPMAHRLTIVASPARATARFPDETFVPDRVMMPEAMFRTPLDQIAEAITWHANVPTERKFLPSWSERESADV